MPRQATSGQQLFRESLRPLQTSFLQWDSHRLQTAKRVENRRARMRFKASQANQETESRIQRTNAMAGKLGGKKAVSWEMPGQVKPWQVNGAGEANGEEISGRSFSSFPRSHFAVQSSNHKYLTYVTKVLISRLLQQANWVHGNKALADGLPSLTGKRAGKLRKTVAKCAKEHNRDTPWGPGVCHPSCMRLLRLPSLLQNQKHLVTSCND
jgi:hypothetical protein